VAIWYYLVIALAVAAALFVIYIFQKKLFSREKLMERRIAKGQCSSAASSCLLDHRPVLLRVRSVQGLQEL